MNDTNSMRVNTVDNAKKSFLTPVGAVIVLICYFLPWVNYSLAGQGRNYTGADIGGITWVVFAAALVILIAHFLVRSDHGNNPTLPIVLVAAIAGLVVMAIKYLNFADAEQGLVGSFQSIQYGLILTLLGFVLSIIGALTARRSWDRVHTTTTNTNRLNEKPLQR